MAHLAVEEAVEGVAVEEEEEEVEARQLGNQQPNRQHQDQ